MKGLGKGPGESLFSPVGSLTNTVVLDLEGDCWRSAGATAARFVVDIADDVRCDGEIRSNIRVVVRESATNAVKHGHAENITISVVRSGYHVIVHIADDGVGMPAEPSSSSGLSNLRGRAEQLGGSMTVGPRDGGGTVVTWKVPLPTGTEN